MFSSTAIMHQNISEIILAFLLFRLVKSMECERTLSTIHSNSITYIGCEFNNWKGEKCKAFRGIPYAKAPIGKLRFKDPAPIEENHFNDIDARKEGKDCPSIFTTNASEDCLHLNVYSKITANNTLPRPVIVFIHPGGFYGGTGASTFLGPEYLLEKNIILVTFNYRLASLGFLNLGIPEVPGNAGLKDQVMALRWTRDNIQHFGGDPNNVTLAGYSAGAMSVCLHLTSPMSQGLFHKAIIMSGSIPSQSKIPLYNQIDLAKKQALVIGCNESISSPDDIRMCLDRYTGIEIAKTLRRMFAFGKDNPIFLWLPVIEQDFEQERFLIEDPYVSFKAGRFAKVPLLIGFTNGEFCTSAQEIITNDFLIMAFNRDFERLAPICFMYSNHRRENEITKEIRNYYFRNNAIDESKFEQLCDVFSDSLVRFGVYKLAKLTSEYVNVYPYRFSYKGRFSNFNYPGHNAEHMDDLFYIFKMPLYNFSPKSPETAAVELITNFITKFVIHGKPEEDFEFKAHKFAEIHSTIEVRNKPYFERNFFWDNVTEPRLYGL